MTYYRNAFLLDDDPITLFLLEDTLAEEKVAQEISCYSRFKDLLPAFKRLAEQEDKEAALPDLLLLDLYMPGRDGLEVLEDILQIPGIGSTKVCVFVLSASYQPQMVVKLKDYPINGYFTKPLDPQAIQQLIQSAKRDECELKEHR